MESLVAELFTEKDNGWEGTMHQKVERWTSGAWQKVYDFLRGGKGMTPCSKKICDGKFSN